MSDSKKTAPFARGGFEQAQDAGKAAVDAAARSSREALGRSENVLNRGVDELGQIGVGMTEAVARGADATVDLSQRLAEQCLEAVQFGMRMAGGVNSRLADESGVRQQRSLETTIQVLETYREAAETSAEKVQTLFASWTTFGRGLQQVQLTSLQLLDRALKGASHKPQDLLRAKSIAEFAAIQRDLYLDTVNYAFEASSALLQLTAGVAQEARPAAPTRSLIVPAQ